MKKLAILFVGCLLGLAVARDLPKPTQAGYIEVDSDHGANLYYYFVESQSNPATDPLVIWLQGGPGCSSLFGAFVENGPQLIDEQGDLHDNPWSWNKQASVIFIDQPAGTGFSYVKDSNGYVHDEKTVAAELYTFITTFLSQYPAYAKLDFYIFGESYAGKYIPSFATEIMNRNAQNPVLFVNLKGIGMGDGWVYPYIQTGSYAPFLYSHNLISKTELNAAEKTYASYKALMDAGSYKSADVVGNGLLSSLTFAANVDVYDIRYGNNQDPTDPLSDALATYFGVCYLTAILTCKHSDVKTAMKAKGDWTACDTKVYSALTGDMERSVDKLLPDLLANYQVINYNGDKDVICNLIGTTQWTNSIQWPGQGDYISAANNTWTVNGKEAGYYRYAGNLTHLIVYDAGHMAPFNQPENTFNLLMTFIAGGFSR